MDLNSGLLDRLKTKYNIKPTLLKSLNGNDPTTPESLLEDSIDTDVTCIPDTPSPQFKKSAWKRSLGKGMDAVETQERKKYKPSPEHSYTDTLPKRCSFQDKSRSEALEKLKAVRQKKKSKSSVFDSNHSKENSLDFVDSDKDIDTRWPSDSDTSSEENFKLISIFDSTSEKENTASFSKKFEKLSCGVSTKQILDDCLSKDKHEIGIDHSNLYEEPKLNNHNSPPRDVENSDSLFKDFSDTLHGESVDLIKLTDFDDEHSKDERKVCESIPCSSTDTFISRTNLKLKSSKGYPDKVCNVKDSHISTSRVSVCTADSSPVSENFQSANAEKSKYSQLNGDSGVLPKRSDYYRTRDVGSSLKNSMSVDCQTKSPKKCSKFRHNYDDFFDQFDDENESPRSFSQSADKIEKSGDIFDRMSASLSYLDDFLDDSFTESNDCHSGSDKVLHKNQSLDDSALLWKSPNKSKKTLSSYSEKVDVIETNRSKRHHLNWNKNKDCDTVKGHNKLHSNPAHFVSHLNIPDTSVFHSKSNVEKTTTDFCDKNVCDNPLTSSFTVLTNSTSYPSTTTACSSVMSHSIKINSKDRLKDLNSRKNKAAKSKNEDSKTRNSSLFKDRSDKKNIVVIDDDSDEDLERDLDFLSRLTNKNKPQDLNRRKARASGLRKNRLGSRTSHVVNRAGDSSFITAFDFAKSLEENETVSVVKQLEGDEEMARKLQEEMDREFALSIQNVDSPQVHAHSSADFPTFTPNLPDPLRDRSSRYRRRSESPPQFANLEGFEGTRLPARNPWAHSSPPRRPTTRSRSRHGRHSNRANFVSEMYPDVDVDVTDFDVFTYRDALERLEDQFMSRFDDGPSQRRGRRRGRYRSPSNMAFAFTNSPSVEGDDYEALWDLAERLGEVRSKGLSKSDINRLPVKTFKHEDNSNENKSDCLICMTEYEEGSSLRILTCFHQFHKACIDRWLEENNTCPICRVEVSL